MKKHKGESRITPAGDHQQPVVNEENSVFAAPDPAAIPTDEELQRMLRVGLSSLDGAVRPPEPSLAQLTAMLKARQATVRRRSRLEICGFLGTAVAILAGFFFVLRYAPHVVLPLQAGCLTLPLLLLSVRSMRSGRRKGVKP